MPYSSFDSIGPYRLIRLLGQGGMGQVYLARRVFAGGVERPCVVKTIRPDLATKPSHEQMFFREAKILATLNHQNIVQVLDFDRYDSLVYLAMEFIDGHDLSVLLSCAAQRGDRLPLAVTLRIAVEVLRGLDYAHRRADDTGRNLGIVHRDLTPNNILISKEGEVKIVDFGLAKSTASSSFTQAGTLKGKWHYMAPEQIEAGRSVDQRTDLFSMGVVLYEMLTGVRPFLADTVSSLLARIVQGDFPPASSVADVPRELDRVLARALARDPVDRYASAAEMLADLEALLVQLSSARGNVVREYVLEVGVGNDATAIESGLPDPLASKVVRQPNGESRIALSDSAVTVSSGGRSGPAIKWAFVVGAALLVILVAFWVGRSANVVEPSPTPLVTQSPVMGSPTPVPVAIPTPSPTPPKPDKTPAPLPTVAMPNPTPPLNAAPGRLRVHDLVPYAEVFVDGKDIGPSPVWVDLPPGPHQVRLRNPDLNRQETRVVTIRSGETVSIGAWATSPSATPTETTPAN